MASKQQQQAFLARVVPICQNQANRHGNKLFASVAIAQAAHESGWGTSKKMVAANALYGVKVGKSAWKFGAAWKGAAYKTGTTEYYDGKNPTKIVDYFRQYDNLNDATCDYMDMLCTCKRYRAALNCKTPEQSIRAIVAGGYATGPDYAKHIMATIRAHNLTQYDGGVCAVVNPYPVPVKILRRGMRGMDVKWLQWELDSMGYKLTVDGCFGPTTEKVVKTYQLGHGLIVDGIVGPKTIASLTT